MKRILKIVAVPLIGIVVVMAGFVYDVIFAGIPYQDPTPELQAKYDFHSFIADLFYKIGGILFLAGLIVIPILLIKNNKTKYQQAPAGDSCLAPEE